METRPLGTSGIGITPILMGLWQAGKNMWVGIDDHQTAKAVRAAFEAGITTFDTAEAYGEGHSERILGKALADLRSRVVIATKVFANHLRYDEVLAACDRSLRNLGTDYIDLYQIHWPAGSFGSDPVPVAETLQAMSDLKTRGKIRAIGVSNFSRTQLEEACSVTRIESIQPPYSLFWRQIEGELLPFCRDHRITILAYSPMAQGILSGKFGPDHQFHKRDNRARNRLTHPDLWPRVQTALDRLRPIAEGLGITLGQLALAWVLHQPMSCAIAGARNPDQIRESAQAAAVSLSPEILARLDAIGRTVTDHLDDNPVQWAWN